jgi:hypothetical protein
LLVLLTVGAGLVIARRKEAAGAGMVGVFLSYLAVGLLGTLIPMMQLVFGHGFGWREVLAAGVGVPALAVAVALAAVLEDPRAAEREGGTKLCKVCGYDLRASRERCPECGTTIQDGG